MKNVLIHILYVIIDFIEKAVWYVKKENLRRRLGACGKNVHIGRHFMVTCPENIFIGDDVYIGDHCRLQSTNSHIYIGNHVMLAPEVAIHGGNHRYDIVGRYMKSIRLDEKREGIDDADVVIEDDCWVAGRSIILKGVTIGKGCVIGGGAIISKNTENYAIVVGCNKQIGKRFTDEQIKIHEELLK